MIGRALGVALVLLATHALPTRAQSVERLSAAFPEVDRLMRAFADSAGVPGFAYGILVDGRLVHLRTGGVRDVGARAPVEDATVFRIGSMTKSFTALAILQLRDQGRLSLDDPVARYVPEMAGGGDGDAPAITIRHLLTHSAGFPEDNPWGDRQLDATDEELAAMLRAGIPPSTTAGTAYEYSNVGFAILGRIVASVSGTPYPAYVRDRILLPLGMTATTMEPGDVPASRLARGYRREGARWVEEAQVGDGAFGPMGGMLSTVGDLARWVSLMLGAWEPAEARGGEPLRRSSLREMQQMSRFAGATVTLDTTSRSVSLSASGYGYGLRVARSCLFPVVVGHGGGLPGFGTLMRWLPDRGVGIVALGNLTYASWGGVADRALEALARTGGMEPRPPRPAPVLLERREQLDRLLLSWSDPLADSVAAENLFLDEAKASRRAAIERLRAAAGGSCRSEGAMAAENALRGRWRVRCRDGDLAVSATLAPTAPARVQFLEVTPIRRDAPLAPAPACR